VPIKYICETFCNLVWANMPDTYIIKHQIKNKYILFILKNNKHTIRRRMNIEFVIKNQDALWEMAIEFTRIIIEEINE